MLTGTFTPSADRPSLTRAPHITRNSTPVTARFSSSTGLPQIPDNDPKSNPRGLAVRFQLAEHVHTDIVSHSTDGFPTRTGQEFLEFLRAAASSDPSKPSPSPIETFLASHPKALAFVQTPKPSPSSLARESYFGVTALRFTNKDSVSRHGRYRITPAGIESVRLPPRSPNLNAYAERFVRSIRESCLERVIFFGENSLRNAVREFVAHYYLERNHQGLGNRLIVPMETKDETTGAVERRQRLGGLLNYYYRKAA
jgi:Integrase core domain/Catalase